MDKVSINGNQYLFKPSNYALGVTLKRTGESLQSVQKALSDIDFLYEYIYQTIKFNYSAEDKKFKYSDNKFKFFSELDSDQPAIETCLSIIAASYETGDEGEEEEALASKKKEVKP